MTPKIIELKQAPVVLVETGKHITNIEARLLEISHASRYLGYLSDLTEEQFEECVAPKSIRTGLFAHYFGGVFPPNTYCYSKASYSFDSLLESEKVYVGENPFGYSPSKICMGEALSWEQAESRTIDPSRTVVLLRKEEQKC